MGMQDARIPAATPQAGRHEPVPHRSTMAVGIAVMVGKIPPPTHGTPSLSGAWPSSPNAAAVHRWNPQSANDAQYARVNRPLHTRKKPPEIAIKPKAEPSQSAPTTSGDVVPNAPTDSDTAAHSAHDATASPRRDVDLAVRDCMGLASVPGTQSPLELVLSGSSCSTPRNHRSPSIFILMTKPKTRRSNTTPMTAQSTVWA